MLVRIGLKPKNKISGSVMIDWQIIPFEGKVEKYMDRLVHLDKVCLSAYGLAWTKANFMLDLPQKGQLSKLAILGDNLIGYLICFS